MAQVIKRKWTDRDGAERTSKVWYARFQVRGKDVLRSTGKTKHPAAVAEMRRMVEAAQSGTSIDRVVGKFRSELMDLPEEQRDDARKDVAKNLFGQLQKTLDAMPGKEHEQLRKEFSALLMHGIGEKLLLAETWAAWRKHPNTGDPAPRTLEGYQGQWNRFEGWAKKQGIDYLHETTPAHAEKYAADLWGSGISPRTYNAHTKFMKSLFKVLRLQSSVEVNPFDDIRTRENATESRRNLTTKELETVWTKSDGDLHDLIVVGICTGMRLGDAVCLEWDSVHFDDNQIVYMPQKTRRKKKEVPVPMTEGLASVLQRRRELHAGQYAFPALRKIYMHDHSVMSNMFTTFLRDVCKIETNEAAESVEVQRKNAVARVGFHSLRHSFVSLLAAKGVPQVVAQEMVGHGSPAVTAIYSHAGDEQKQQAIKSLPEFGKDNGGQRKLN